MKRTLLITLLAALCGISVQAQTKAYYTRPQGNFFVTYYSTDGKASITGYYAPKIHCDPNTTVKFVNRSTDAATNAWTYWTEDPDSRIVTEYQAETKDLEFVMGENKCTVPVLTVSDASGETTSTYQLNGYKSSTDGATEYIGELMSDPNYINVRDVEYDRHAWSSSKYFGVSNRREPNDQTSGIYTMTYSTSGTVTGHVFGKNKKGENGIGTAFEKPLTPYLVRSAAIRLNYVMLADEAASADLTVTIYELESIPAYDETTYVTLKPGKVLATKTVTVNKELLADTEKFSYSKNTSTYSPGYYYGMLRFDFDQLLKIDTPILVAVSGYNNDAFKFITTYSSNDYFDEGYGELGYVLGYVDGEPTWKGFNNLISNLKGRKAAPAVFIEVERPNLNWGWIGEETEHEFQSEGGEVTVDLYATRGEKNMTVEKPDWVTVTLKDTESSYGYENETKMTIVADEYPAEGNNELVCREGDVVVTLQGIRSVKYHVKQQQTTSAISDVNADAAVKCVKYVNAQGIVSDTPFLGINMVVTTYEDGTTKTKKQIFD